MSIDLFNLDPEDLWKYQYKEIRDVVQAIEQDLFGISGDVKEIEAIVNYLDYINIISIRVEECDFDEISKERLAKSVEAESARQWMQLRLNTIFLSCKSVLDYARVVNDYNAKKLELEKSIGELHNEFNKKNAEIEKSLADARILVDKQLASAKTKVDNQLESAKNEIQNTEHNVLTHTLTLMGIFSAVITIVMSIAITSSSWLNNANGASAILAFVVPNAVTILAVVILLFLVFLYHNATTGIDTHPIKCRTATAMFLSMFAIVLLLVGSLIWISWSYTQKGKPEHIHHVIGSEDYSVSNQEVPDSNNEERYFQFFFDGKRYQFVHDEDFIHDGNLYYCQVHDTIE